MVIEMKRIIILVPIYKKKITILEKISLIQLNKILGGYEIRFIAPYNIGNIEYDFYKYRIDYFPDIYFSSIPKYSHLLLSTMFCGAAKFLNWIVIMTETQQ